MNLKNLLIFIFSVSILFGCKQTEPVSDSLNYETTIEDEVMLFGPVDRTGLMMEEYVEWFDENYQLYEPNDSIIDLLKNQLDNVSIKIFMGTWCSDSQRDIPAFYQVIDGLGTKVNYSIIAVDRSKERPENYVEGHEIEYVPTFIFYRGQEELGRIVEIPELTLEEDMLNILSSS